MTTIEVLEKLRELDKQIVELKRERLNLSSQLIEKQRDYEDLIIDIKHDIIMSDENYRKLKNQTERDIYMKKVIKDNVVANRLESEINVLSNSIQNIDVQIEEVIADINYYNSMLNFGLTDDAHGEYHD